MRAAPDCALDDEIVTIRPHRAASMSGTTAWRQWNVPVRLTARTRPQRSGVMSRKDSNASTPALVTMISTRPSSARTFSSAPSTASRSVTSTCAPIVRAPVSRRLSAARSTASPWRSRRATRSPRAAKCRPIASPMPDAAPVTTATLPIARVLPPRTAIMADGRRPSQADSQPPRTRFSRTGSPGCAFPPTAEPVETEFPSVLGRDLHPALPGETTHQPAVHHRLLDEQDGTPWAGHLKRVGRDGGVEQLDQHARDRRHHRGQPLGILDRELQRELRDRESVVRSAFSLGPERLTPFVQADRERAEPLERPGFRLDGLVAVLDRLADDLLEQREQQLVLAVEVLVEPSQRLLRAVDDLLDRELARPLLVDELERRVQESLDTPFGARARCAEAARDGSLPPAPDVFISCAVHFRHGGRSVA